MRENDLTVVIVDLPDMDRAGVRRQARTSSDCRVLVCTTGVADTDAVLGVSMGAADHVSRPFQSRQLTLREPMVSRRPRQLLKADTPAPEVEVQLDLERRDVHLRGAPVELTPIEFEILAVLVSEPRVAFSRRELINRIWSHDWSADRHLVPRHLK